MFMTALFRDSRIWLALGAAALLLGAQGMSAGQSLSKLKIGDDLSKSSWNTREPSVTSSYKGFLLRKWTLQNGNDLSVTTDSSARIVHLESDWNGQSDETGCDLADLKFGETTLTDIRKRLGSNGFEFKERAGSIPIPDGVVMLNSYEVGGNVVTFFTKVTAEEYHKIMDSRQTWIVADHARLDAISIASADYAKSEWGERIYDPNYKNVVWK